MVDEYVSETTTEIPLPEGQLDFFKVTSFKQECCPISVSTTTGCAFLTPEKMEKLINKLSK